ncbi:hypothetical protein ASG63_08630 [Methylobacterium sp. Leaf94]|uniref:hypothetical protein n=1 Tax=Methylobacterium sp. Leaf94 TaxID=1736250 RepID=UPI0006F7C79D|nr:hypothetical protein [Methylobacterium sp. Leaf94]KQU17567.1 hypothetical protein ASG63_08630 [Methylobacterium sp. Leaf94]
MDERTLGSLAQAGRAAKGEVIRRAVKSRSYSEMDAAVCVEAAFVLGSGTRGERAAEIGHNVTQGLFPRRGLDYVCITPEERGRAASIGSLANAGNADAIAEREQRYAHELAVGQVLRTALALVPTQPEFGRYLLPPVDDALRAALSGQDQAAIEAVFPDLALVAPAEVPAEEDVPVAVPLPDPTPPAEVPAVSETTPDHTPHIHRRAPDDSIIRRDHAEGGDLVPLAARYGISPTSLYAHWRKMNLSGRGRMDGLGAAQRQAEEQVVEPAPQEAAPADVPAAPVAPEPVAPSRPVGPYGALAPEEAVAVVAHIQATAPLGLHDLGRAVDIAALKGLSRADAIAWIREDIRAVALTRVIPPAEDVVDNVAISNEAIANDVFRELMLADERGTRQ